MTAANEPIPKICASCGKEYLAFRATGNTCSDKCSNRWYKQRKRLEKVAKAEEVIQEVKMERPVIELSYQAKDELEQIIDRKIREHNTALFEKIKYLIINTLDK
jgi:predicted nucleic acid-binding Zn ribbon protein